MASQTATKQDGGYCSVCVFDIRWTGKRTVLFFNNNLGEDGSSTSWRRSWGLNGVGSG
jgi:hypothetical protein